MPAGRPQWGMAGRSPGIANLAAPLALAAAVACARSDPASDNGRALIAQRGCGACHEIPGIRGASGNVGPTLDAMGRRTYISGRLPNTPTNLAAFIRDPKSIEPRTGMPTLGLSAEEARDMAAYLGTLR